MYIFRSILNRNATPNYQIIFRSFSQLNQNELLNYRFRNNELLKATRHNTSNRSATNGAEDSNEKLIELLKAKQKQSTGQGGKAIVAEDFLANKLKRMKKKIEKPIKVLFVADRDSTMRWNFKPTQHEIRVYPGETALAFFTAKNPTNQGVNGVSTYSVAPVEARKYLNKIQCFCFEEQRLEPGEEVDMPVFFYFDSDFADDPRLDNVNEVSLSYTFFEAKEQFKMPSLPSFGIKSNSVQPAIV